MQRLNFDSDIDARRQVQLLELVHRFGGRFDNINQPFVGALFERFLRFLIRMRRALNCKALDAGRQRDWPGNTSAGSFYRIGDVTGGLVNDAMVKGLESNANALSSHRKNNCLLMVRLIHVVVSRFGEANREYSKRRPGRNCFLTLNTLLRSSARRWFAFGRIQNARHDAVGYRLEAEWFHRVSSPPF